MFTLTTSISRITPYQDRRGAAVATPQEAVPNPDNDVLVHTQLCSYRVVVRALLAVCVEPSVPNLLTRALTEVLSDDATVARQRCQGVVGERPRWSAG